MPGLTFEDKNTTCAPLTNVLVSPLNLAMVIAELPLRIGRATPSDEDEEHVDGEEQPDEIAST